MSHIISMVCRELPLSLTSQTYVQRISRDTSSSHQSVSLRDIFLLRLAEA